ncbi:hypothetical protein LOTGIDRAFT_153579 [Lottia gigantea]|uniref:C-type lectin domain-containing protein n=1 Tax=Lottia gigantea TaxID=225164 RepID=V4BQI3_LOTGI|nr:hypothetical protein LOTGIDRAFT_153579 [Lottia gigantea]ESO91149.1 hypothetical protein LOTGIDRAFT_153579 [Lottia gigantea]
MADWLVKDEAPTWPIFAQSTVKGCTYESYWRPFDYTGPVTLNYYRLIPTSGLGRCARTCSSLYNSDLIYYQGEDCYCLAPVYEESSLVSGTVTTNREFWTIRQDVSYCTERGYTIFSDHRYCLKYFSRKSTWYHAESTCRQDGGHLVSLYTQQDLTNLRSLYTNDTIVFIGGHRTLDGTKLDWIIGGTIHESFWNFGEPNNHKREEWCVFVRENGTLNDISCLLHYHFVCQIL